MVQNWYFFCPSQITIALQKGQVDGSPAKSMWLGFKIGLKNLTFLRTIDKQLWDDCILLPSRNLNLGSVACVKFFIEDHWIIEDSPYMYLY